MIKKIFWLLLHRLAKFTRLAGRKNAPQPKPMRGNKNSLGQRQKCSATKANEKYIPKPRAKKDTKKPRPFKKIEAFECGRTKQIRTADLYHVKVTLNIPSHSNELLYIIYSMP